MKEELHVTLRCLLDGDISESGCRLRCRYQINLRQFGGWMAFAFHELIQLESSQKVKAHKNGEIISILAVSASIGGIGRDRHQQEGKQESSIRFARFTHTQNPHPRTSPVCILVPLNAEPIPHIPHRNACLTAPRHLSRPAGDIYL